MRPSGPRSPIAGPPSPENPFPIPVSGPIVKGFGRGSADLGIPTANIPLAGLSVGGHDELESGVYYGWAGVAVDVSGTKLDVEERDKKGETGGNPGAPPSTGNEAGIQPIPMPGGTVFPMVMSLGYNPYYQNTVRSIEVHILHRFEHDFYGARMNILICGFIRPEYDYVSKESLVDDINVDIEVARRSLERVGYVGVLRDKGWWERVTDFRPVVGEEAASNATAAKANGEVERKL